MRSIQFIDTGLRSSATSIEGRVKMVEKTRKTKGMSDDVDKHVGKRLRVRRSLVGMSQEKLANALGITFQQVQKYERGSNRISASRLFKMSKVLEVPVDYFYDDMEGNKEIYGMSDNAQEAFGENMKYDVNLLSQRETIDLVRSYYSIKDIKQRKDILKNIRAAAKAE